ncbi:hypothetical protein CC1G_04089 [Coprinopsis cinerea okayama7|uniref:Uncharacterized protein n=1 Tax=Coprinopsis cinerea (strain Okayama-7 / 130 / ATCC MYA-4618 / FGSC 9003) TaxID=240176 RepID=A8NVX8_COPC7|nr:hypothetical protein CC1G_04089 [Coprinopsis cinerea okayama7\|eukprot:XP_001836776.2 hypothetical protein CC1G_04089 [Coprinopsis cinerea okayama7\
MPITPTWPDDLRLSPYFSRMTSDSLRALAPDHNGALVFLFPAQGNPIVVPTGFHAGHGNLRRPIDLDVSRYLDLDGDRVVQLSSRMALFPRLPLESSEVLRVGFAVYFCAEGIYTLHRNACLQSLFTTPVPIGGNIVVATVSAEGVVIDATPTLLQQALLIAGM